MCHIISRLYSLKLGSGDRDRDLECKLFKLNYV